jgi:transposase
MKTVTEHTADKQIVGIDVGVATLATVHNGSKALQFHHHAGLDKMIKRISILNEQMSRKRRVDKVNSKNREKARAKRFSIA